MVLDRSIIILIDITIINRTIIVVVSLKLSESLTVIKHQLQPLLHFTTFLYLTLSKEDFTQDKINVSIH